MLSNQTKCIRCGAVILQRTANENYGQCIPCRRTKDGCEFAPKSSEWSKLIYDSILCFIAGSLDEIDSASKSLSEQILPRFRVFTDQGIKFLDEFVDLSKLGEGKWCVDSIRFPSGGRCFEINYDGPDCHHYIWTVVFSVNSNDAANPYRPIEARRTFR